MSDLLSVAADMGSEQSLSILIVGGMIIFAVSAIWSAVERYLERLAQAHDA